MIERNNKNINNKNNYVSGPNYQISGSEPNYNYNGMQNLNFDSSSIPQSGFSNLNDLTNAVNDQQQFVNNYNSYKPNILFT